MRADVPLGEEDLRKPFPQKLTLRWIARNLRMNWRAMSSLPRNQRVIVLRQWLELLLYGWWQHKRGLPFHLPVGDDSLRPRRVTKQIPEIYVNVFGRRLYLLVGAVIESVPIEDGAAPEQATELNASR